MKDLENLKEKIKNYLEENTDEYEQLVSERMSYDGWNQDDEIYDMEMLPELFSTDSRDSFENLMNRIYFGHDDENGDSSSFNPNKDYFYFNGYGNLVSTDYRDYSDFMDDMVEDIVSGELEDSYFDVPNEIQQMLDEYNEEDE